MHLYRYRDANGLKRDTVIHPSAKIATTAVIDNPFRPTLGGCEIKYRATRIAEGVFIGHFATVGAGCYLGPGVIIDDYVKLEPNVTVGANTLLTHRALVSLGSTIGRECVIGGFLTDRTQVGARCRVFGNVIHSHRFPARGWDDDESVEESAVIRDDVFVGFGAQIIGNIILGHQSYVAANAVITRSVPAGYMGYGYNGHRRERCERMLNRAISL